MSGFPPQLPAGSPNSWAPHWGARSPRGWFSTWRHSVHYCPWRRPWQPHCPTGSWGDRQRRCSGPWGRTGLSGLGALLTEGSRLRTSLGPPPPVLGPTTVCSRGKRAALKASCVKPEPVGGFQAPPCTYTTHRNCKAGWLTLFPTASSWGKWNVPCSAGLCRLGVCPGGGPGQSCSHQHFTWEQERVTYPASDSLQLSTKYMHSFFLIFSGIHELRFSC